MFGSVGDGGLRDSLRGVGALGWASLFGLVLYVGGLSWVVVS